MGVDQHYQDVLVEKFCELNKILESLEKPYKKDLIKAAYTLVREAHGEQEDKKDTRHLLHPLNVAIDLARLGFDSNIIAAGLVHNLIDHSECTLQKISKVTNEDVASIVDALMHIERKKFHETQEEVDEFENLKFVGSTNIYAYFIRFADRLDDFKTNEAIDEKRQEYELKQTREVYIPIARQIHSSYYVSELMNQCFKLNQRNYYDQIKYNYQMQMDKTYNSSYLLDNVISTIKNGQIEFMEKEVLPYEIFGILEKQIHNIHDDFETAFDKCIIPIRHFFVLYDADHEEDMRKALFQCYNEYFYVRDIVLVKPLLYEGKPSFILSDRYDVSFQFTPLLKKDYFTFLNGELNSSQIEDVKNNLQVSIQDEHSRNMPQIFVYNQDGVKQQFAQGSTLYDYILLCKQKDAIYTKFAIIDNEKIIDFHYPLQDGDSITLMIGDKMCITIDSLAYTFSQEAKLAAIRLIKEDASK